MSRICIETGGRNGHAEPDPIDSTARTDYLQVRLVLNGDERVGFGHASTDLQSGDMCARHPDQPFTATTRGCELLTLEIAPGHLAHPIPGAVHGKVFRSSDPLCQLLGGHLRRLLHILPGLEDDGVEPVIEITCSHLRTCLGIECGPRRVSPAAEPLRQRILTHIESHITAADLSIAGLQRIFHVSRARLYRILEPEGGIARLIARKRVDGAFHEIRNSPNRRLSEIAGRWGFTSMRQFQRAFHVRFECSPGALRRMQSDPLAAATRQSPDLSAVRASGDQRGEPSARAASSAK